MVQLVSDIVIHWDMMIPKLHMIEFMQLQKNLVCKWKCIFIMT